MAAPRSVTLNERDLLEINRSAEESKASAAISIDRAQIERYLHPPADTIYGLEYAFHLLGDIRGKRIADFGCGKGENLLPLSERGASNLVGIDISSDLLQLAEQRVRRAGTYVRFLCVSAYDTGIPDESMDGIFCIALVHHLSISAVRMEMRRILKKGGFIVLSEPIRFSRTYDRLRKLLPAKQNISEFEHPLTAEEFKELVQGFSVEQMRFFRLPFVPLFERLFGRTSHAARTLSAWLIRHIPASRHFATNVVVRLRK